MSYECSQKMKLDSIGLSKKKQKVTEASSVTTLEIAKQKKNTYDWETLIKPYAFKMAEIVLGNKLEKKL